MAMPLTIFLVFASVFAVIALLMTAMRGNSQPSEQVRANLASALKLDRLSAPEEAVDIRKHHTLSSVPWVRRLLEFTNASDGLQCILDQAELKWSPGRLLLMSAAGLIIPAYLINLQTGFGAMSFACALPAAGAPFFYMFRKRQARFDRFQKALADALDLMVNALRAGHSLSGALGIVASDSPEPVRREFRLCFEEQNFGLDLRTALEHLLRRVPLLDLRIVATAILIQKETGGNLAEVLDKTACLIRDRFRLMDMVRVHTAQSRLTGTILTAAPFVLGSVLYFVNPQYMAVLFTRALGHKMMGLGAGMNLMGLLVIRKIVRIRV